MKINRKLQLKNFTDKNNDKNKTNFPLSPSTPVTVFIIAEKLLHL